MTVMDGPVTAAGVKSKTYDTSIPTTVHLDLLTAKDIPDPFLLDNYPKVEWVSKLTVKYTLNFGVQV